LYNLQKQPLPLQPRKEPSTIWYVKQHEVISHSFVAYLHELD